MGEIVKARCITDAQIQFVSLVDKAANKKSFLIAKADDGEASFSAYGKIVKTDTDSHYVTGIVYEPMTEDSQGDFMTEDEIRKAAHWFAKNGDGIDIQHNFKKFEKAEVVESWIAKADFEIGKEKIKKGSWLMTVEITDKDVWAAVEKGEITGFSMGGKGVYSEDDVDLDSLNKSESKSFFKKLAKMFGFEVVEKNKFVCENEESEENMTKSEAQEFIEGLVKKAMEKYAPEPEPQKDDFEQKLQKAVDMAVEKSMEKQNSGLVTKDEVVKMVADSIAKAVEPLYKSRGIVTNLNDEPEPVSKSDDIFDGMFV